jgi:hypothetical protein
MPEHISPGSHSVRKMMRRNLREGLRTGMGHFPPWRVRLLSEQSCPRIKGLRNVGATFQLGTCSTTDSTTRSPH